MPTYKKSTTVHAGAIVLSNSIQPDQDTESPLPAPDMLVLTRQTWTGNGELDGLKSVLALIVLKSLFHFRPLSSERGRYRSSHRLCHDSHGIRMGRGELGLHNEAVRAPE